MVKLYLFEVEGDGDPFEASAVLQRGTLPPAVGSVDHVADGMAVLGVFIVAYLQRIKNKLFVPDSSFFKKNKRRAKDSSFVFLNFYLLFECQTGGNGHRGY